MAKRTYPLGNEFPAEEFVQGAVAAHFRNLGFSIDESGHVDLACCHPSTSEQWHVEAKGKTKQVGLDFRTCLGQLVQRMSDRNIKYAIALPDTPQYQAQVGAVSPWVVDALSLHWLFVSPDGSVRMLSPTPTHRPDA